ncbi:MAG: SCO family protein [Deltaproteobacteria bacterium]|nr:SCO family protein [Deltaproteobacteria bacterium]
MPGAGPGGDMLAFQKPALFNPFPNVGFDQRLDEQLPLDLSFADETGKAVQLRDYFGGKPVLLSLAYYDCPMLCTLVLNGLVRTLRTLAFSAGTEFNVLTVSFDSREKPPLAAEKRKIYLDAYNRPGADTGWHFLTGDEAAIQQLTKAVGFRYSYDQSSQQFAHASGIMILTPEGRLSHYFFGIEYAPRDVRLGLVEASAGKIGSAVDQILLLCFHYDPAAGKYGLFIMRIVQTLGFLTMVALGSYVFAMLRRERKQHLADGATPAFSTGRS